jgi:maltooligosyltrehalose trehalohydrolase
MTQVSAEAAVVDEGVRRRRLPLGAELTLGRGADFRVWAPRLQRVEVVFPSAAGSQSAEQLPSVLLTRDAEGYFSGHSSAAGVGTRYGFRLDGEAAIYPDPASRFQPEGPHAASMLVDPSAYPWHDSEWQGPERKGQIIYEMHIGTFTKEGTWAAAQHELPQLRDLGVTLLEVMPVAEFDGRFGWGYDGVDLFAPTRLYGSPDDFRRFVDEAHRLGLGVILDVVYNHFGPSGNYLSQYVGDAFVSRRHHTDWGEAVNFDGENSKQVREFIVANAGYWIDEFHIDGLRLDAVHAIVDDSKVHILAAIGRRVREAAGSRKALVILENELQQAQFLRSAEDGGSDLDMAWNDDFHHSARVAMTGHSEYYYGDYQGSPQELVSAAKWGYLYQGQWNARQQRRRGTPALDLDACQFVNFLQNHDQVGNSAQGRRAHELTSPGRHRALTALLLLGPGTPLLFQGQEFSASARFVYFADHSVDLAKLVREGRQEGMRHFRSLTGPDVENFMIDPCDPETFANSKLDHGERDSHPQAYALHCDLLRLRREDPTFAAQRSDRIHGAVLAAEAFALRYLGVDDDDRLLLVNLGRDLQLSPLTEPLMVPPPGMQWTLLWSTEDPRYGGTGSGLLDTRNWYLQGHAAMVLRPEPLDATP